MSRESFVFVVLFAIAAAAPRHASAQPAVLPSPLSLADVVRIAAERRDEIAAARAGVRAAEARPAIAAALDDPMVSPAIDHLPFRLGGLDVSVTIEQQVPLSGIRGHRRAAATADLERLKAEAARTALDVGIEAAAAFVMLHERRRTATVLHEQIGLATDVVSAASARYASGTATQADVLRAEVEVARVTAMARALDGEVRAAEAMLATALGLDAGTPVPALAEWAFTRPLPDAATVTAALEGRPELAAGRAVVARAAAEAAVMRDRFRPMALIRTGPAYTMADGAGWMAMVGVSLPIWRGKLRAGVAEAEAARDMSEADLRATARMIEGDAAAALARLQSAHERQRALATDVLPRAQMAVAPAISGYTAGQLPLVSVIEALQSLWLVRSDVIAADSQLALAWARLGRALGSYEAIIP